MTLEGLRLVEDTDSAAIIALIGGIWSSYPGVILDVDLEEPWMRAPASTYRDKGGAFWVYGSPVTACVGLRPVSGTDAIVELKSLYVDASLRRLGIGRRLVDVVEQRAGELGAHRIELWSDSRFLEAHVFYASLGYSRTGQTRDLGDISDTTEWQFAKDLL